MFENVRILVCDNEQEVVDEARDQILEVLPNAVVDTSLTPNSAAQLSSEMFYDLAFVDYSFDDSRANADGLSVIRTLRKSSPACITVLMSKYIREEFGEIIRLISPTEGEQIYILNKLDESADWYGETARALVGTKANARWRVEDLESVTDALMANAKRIQQMRSSRDGLQAEVKHVLFRLFDDSISHDLPLAQDHQIRVSMHQMTDGHSSSVVFETCVRYGKDLDGNEIDGVRCVVKIGPRSGIEAEVRAFRRRVQLGVPLGLRVELIGTGYGDRIAGVCYSFAGDGATKAISSLDALLKDKRVDDCAAVVSQLFEPDSRNWYLMSGPAKRIQSYYSDKERYAVSYDKSIEELRILLRKNPNLNFNEAKNRLALATITVEIPARNMMGDGFWQRRRPTCLVHGDLHGGNVLVDGELRVRIIDYATVGFGPRFADAAALGSSIRLIPCEGAEFSLRDLERIYTWEKIVMSGGSLGEAVHEWPASLIESLSRRAVENFVAKDAGEDHAARVEYASVQLAYALSIFTLSRWTTSQRLRLVVWISAAYSFLQSTTPQG